MRHLHDAGHPGQPVEETSLVLQSLIGAGAQGLLANDRAIGPEQPRHSRPLALVNNLGPHE